MSNETHLQGILSKTLDTERGTQHYLSVEGAQGPPLVLIHGNLSSSVYWEELMLSLRDRFTVYAPDLRGFGETHNGPIDATRGVRDFSDDVHALVAALGLGESPVRLIGWSVGGGVAMQYAIDHAAEVASLVLVNPMSPFGFGGTRDAAGTPCWDDFAGSGGGTANPDMVNYLRTGERGGDVGVMPRAIMKTFYVNPAYSFDPEREEALLSSMMSAQISDDVYPGDTATSENWPGVSPGTRGMNNAISAKWCDLSAFADISPKPPVLWLRGGEDQIVSDLSMFDFGALGKLGAVPGWPGEEQYPPQPMLQQIRHVLDNYEENGGSYEEVVIEGSGHTPHLEKPEAFERAVREFL